MYHAKEVEKLRTFVDAGRRVRIRASHTVSKAMVTFANGGGGPYIHAWQP